MHWSFGLILCSRFIFLCFYSYSIFVCLFLALFPFWLLFKNNLVVHSWISASFSTLIPLQWTSQYFEVSSQRVSNWILPFYFSCLSSVYLFGFCPAFLNVFFQKTPATKVSDWFWPRNQMHLTKCSVTLTPFIV